MILEDSLIKSKSVVVDVDVSGQRWEVTDFQELACLVAVITLGQATHAARIISKLEPNAPAFVHSTLCNAARAQLTISGSTGEKKKARIAHRDGFLFECISWIVSRQGAHDRIFQKDPHTSATSQGLDGLIIELHATKQHIKAVTICEDKCTIVPRQKFQSEVLPTFNEHHTGGKRSRELVSCAVDLIKTNFDNDTKATQAASSVMDLKHRSYRAALTVDASIDDPGQRAKLFKDYNSLKNLKKSQRIGATLVIHEELRAWFQSLADAVIDELNKFEASNV